MGTKVDKEENGKSNLVAASFKNAGILMLVQVFSKIMTFTLNFMVARIVTKEVYGYANIQLQLFNSFVLWFAKEAVRKSVQRKVEATEEEAKQAKGKFEDVEKQSASNIVVLS